MTYTPVCAWKSCLSHSTASRLWMKVHRGDSCLWTRWHRTFRQLPPLWHLSSIHAVSPKRCPRWFSSLYSLPAPIFPAHHIQINLPRHHSPLTAFLLQIVPETQPPLLAGLSNPHTLEPTQSGNNHNDKVNNSTLYFRLHNRLYTEDLLWLKWFPLTEGDPEFHKDQVICSKLLSCQVE